MIDSQELFLGSLLQALAAIPTIQILGYAALTMLGSLESVQPDAVVIDPYRGGAFSMEALRAAVQLWPSSHVLILSEYFDADSLAAAASLGVHGYILKSEPTGAIAAGLEFVCRGGTAFSAPIAAAFTARQFPLPPQPVLTPRGRKELTSREMAVLQLVANGLTDSEIGSRMGISARTAERHMTNILNKLGCRNRSQAVAEMFERMPGCVPDVDEGAG